MLAMSIEDDVINLLEIEKATLRDQIMIDIHNEPCNDKKS